MSHQLQMARRLLPAVMLALLCACTSKYRPEHGRADPVGRDEYPQVAVLEGMHSRVMVADVQHEPGPPLGVRVIVRNAADQERWVQYRFIFFDVSGRRETANPDWRTMLLPARTRMELSDNAMDKNMIDWALELRPVH